ncbi:MAG TPA: metal ABC transporter substrate-binding protein [Nocardioides sp.]|nr:metal ABC transporter substrate-binding protein [Nocardioides sp.]
MLKPILGASVLALALSGCAAFSDDGPDPSNGLTVVAGLYPLQWMAQQVIGDHAQVEDLTQPGAEPHDLELTPKEVGDVVSADVIVYEKGLQAAVDQAVTQASGDAAFDATPVAGLEPLSHGGHDDVSHHAGVTSDQEAEESAKDLGDLDPHFWQDPLKLAAVGRALADKMASIDPADAASYHANADALTAELTALDKAYTAGLAHCARNVIVVSHNAFGYLWRYGLDIEPIAGLSPDAEPTPADLGRLQQLIHTEGITTVFGERLVSPALSRTIAHDTGAKTAVLDPIEGLSDATSKDDYLSLMRANLAALRTANGCR